MGSREPQETETEQGTSCMLSAEQVQDIRRMIHDLSNQIFVAQGSSEMLSGNRDPQESAELVSGIYRATQRAKVLSTDLQNTFRDAIRTGKKPIQTDKGC